ncbi:unnamed protein product [Cyclocybe aegerita]|uniref:alpha-1,2-Mannosidase n=1 Tax=Cyclocybe aegerita TaxID=1973307 RepID=A0A8S0VQE4_CYCAE|nr:unnamed protein product [Cyclocybe aegerita]
MSGQATSLPRPPSTGASVLTVYRDPPCESLMKWSSYWLECLFIAIVLAINGFRCQWFATDASSALPASAEWTPRRKLAAREKTRELWYHGFDNYMQFAFPLDELTPLSCSGQGPDWVNPANIASNDVAGNFSLTLIDVLDTLVVLDDRPGFERAVRNVIDWVSFDVNTKPQVFETTIRVLGGLLSGHIFANQTGQPFHLPWYRGELLALAHDLGKRLLPAFSTPTGLPYARVNLQRGVMKGETLETCTAGAGSLMLEFATLSRLTGDERFEKAAHRAFFGLWNRKSEIGLVGNTINTRTGVWTQPETTSIGAGIDSFFEYALKWYILSGDLEFLDVWDDAYAAIMRYTRSKDGYWYRTVNMHTGDVAYLTVDSLSAFWPGLQVLAGDVQNAIKLHMIYFNLWKQHSGLPEVYDINYKQATSHQYPLRPEFIESTWYLYRATRDPFYLDVGERILFDLTTRAKVDCGLSGIADLRSNKRDDRMESFALSETLKYLYLLFDEENPLHSDDSNYVFTTEGHILTLGPEYIKAPPSAQRRMRKVNSHQCPAYIPFMHSVDHRRKDFGLVMSVQARPDVEYGRHLVGLTPQTADQRYWSPDGWCERPKVEPYTYEFILSPGGKTIPEDLSPNLLKLGLLPDGFILHNVTGVRAQIVQRLDGKGYDISRLGHYSVRPGHLVYINDSNIFASHEDGHLDQDEIHRRDSQIQIRVFGVTVGQPTEKQAPLLGKTSVDISVTAYTAQFGADLSSGAHLEPNQSPPRIRRPEGVAVRRDTDNAYGCDPYELSYRDSMLLVRRGDCTFLEKLLMARDASAAGIIIISDEEQGINPTANSEEVLAAGDLSDSAAILLPKKTGETFEEMLILTEQLKTVQMMVSLQPGEKAGGNIQSIQEQEEQPKDPNRILFINGHPLINTRLLI